MGLSTRTSLSIALASLFLIPAANAAPKLRLETTTVGPVSVATGQNGPAQTVQAYNAGDGSLSLSVTTNVSWINPSVGALVACTNRQGTCLPVAIALRTNTLPKGAYTGTVTVADPNALDAPQTITVTINVGGGVPDSITSYLPPGGAETKIFTSSNRISAGGFTNDGRNWMSVNLEAGGTFRYAYNYQVRLNATGLNAGTYTGRINTADSPVTEENKGVIVTLNVTTQPIAQVVPEKVQVRLMQGSYPDAASPGLIANVSVVNTGQGTLNVTGITPNVQGGNWLDAKWMADGSYVQLAFKPGSTPPGQYTATVQINSNAVAPVSIPVSFEVVAAGAPHANAQGAVNNANFTTGDDIARGAIVALRGEFLTLGDLAQNTQTTLPTTLGGTRVLVNGVAAPLYYSGNFFMDGKSMSQVAFQMPYETALGDAAIQVERGGVLGNRISAKVVDVAPRVLQVGDTNYGIAVNPDYSYALPSSYYGSRPARSNEAIVIYLIGGGITDPAPTTGVAVPYPPLFPVPGTVSVAFGSGNVQPALFGGLSPGFVGLYQVNVIVPEFVQRGDKVPIVVSIDGKQSKPVMIAIE